MKRDTRALFLLLSLLAVAALLYVGRAHYWRPYQDTPQESVVSMHAHGFALANFAGLGRNPVIAREIDVANGAVSEYNHWPNAFFLTLAAAIKLFGNTETVGRSLALAYTVSGLFLLAFAFRNKTGLSYLVVPVVVASPIGRDCLSFVFIDASFIFWIGFLAASVSLTRSRPLLATRLFRSGALVAPFFIHLIAPFAFMGGVARFLCAHRDKRTLFYDLLCVVGAFVAVILLLCWTGRGFVSGGQELLAQYLHRANLSQRYNENVGLATLFAFLGDYCGVNLGPFRVLLPFSYLYLVRQRSLQSHLLLAVLVYSLLLRNYVGVHVFANLPFVAVSFFTLVSGLERMREQSAGLRWAVAGCLLVSLFLPRHFSYYDLNGVVMFQTKALQSLRADIERSPYNRFTILNGDNCKVAQFYCGERVLRGIVNGEEKRRGVIDLKYRTVLPAQ